MESKETIKNKKKSLEELTKEGRFGPFAKEKFFGPFPFLLDKDEARIKKIIKWTYPILGNLSEKVQKHLESEIYITYSKEYLDKIGAKKYYFLGKEEGYYKYDNLARYDKPKSRFFKNMSSLEKLYDPIKATAVSIFTNLIGYSYLIHEELYNSIKSLIQSGSIKLEDWGIGSIVLGIYALLESLDRLANLSDREVTRHTTAKDIADFYKHSAEPVGFAPLFISTIEWKKPTGSLLGKIISLPFEAYLDKVYNKIVKKNKIK